MHISHSQSEELSGWKKSRREGEQLAQGSYEMAKVRFESAGCVARILLLLHCMHPLLLAVRIIL